jgi:hypothetical protein
MRRSQSKILFPILVYDFIASANQGTILLRTHLPPRPVSGVFVVMS